MKWLLKAEPDSRLVKGVDVKYTIDDLEADGTTLWEGVRNPEARKHMLAMRIGDEAFFYRSNTKVPGVVGTMTVVGEAIPDATALDKKHPYFDARATKETNKWVVVDFKYQRHLAPITLAAIKAEPALKDMALVKRSRLSVSPVTDAEWAAVLRLGNVHKEEDAVKKNDDEDFKAEDGASADLAESSATAAAKAKDKARSKVESTPGKRVPAKPARRQKK